MRKKKQHKERIKSKGALLLLPLMAFLLFSCPVKRSLFSAFEKSSTETSSSVDGSSNIRSDLLTSTSDCSVPFPQNFTEGKEVHHVVTPASLPVSTEETSFYNHFKERGFPPSYFLSSENKDKPLFIRYLSLLI